MRIALVLLVAGLAGGAAAQEGAPRASFECKKAVTRIERAVCGNADLARMDGEMGFAYARLLRHAPPGERPAIQQAQRAWLKRRDGCGDMPCLSEAYATRSERIWAEVHRVEEVLRRGVARVGQCQVTTIEFIGGRLSDAPDDDAGTSVGFANAVSLVSYDFERAVAKSRVGDRVRVCLAAIPQDCPPGDDRGREYSVTNLRTGGQWRMPDSQHMCGGA
jgi:uncharacterized protein YecT (DUF1311 family)